MMGVVVGGGSDGGGVDDGSDGGGVGDGAAGVWGRRGSDFGNGGDTAMGDDGCGGGYVVLAGWREIESDSVTSCRRRRPSSILNTSRILASTTYIFFASALRIIGFGE
ncbi:hypothetical protein F0562_035846 [Nyssa sinensis]|uniref:Uncharacterized protein n=1 Tax=Nyssa sinensis TaxID=561372 RepID=A0A5J5AFB2_9ASTE|nr:hypothetical protein F0562_035846 [Nyssa sinensis]